MAKILILEDAEYNHLLYRKFFANIFEVSICINDVQLYEALKKDSFDLFIIDISLPNSKNGIVLIKEIREIEKYKNTPIVVITALVQQHFETMAFDAGCTKFMVKPIENKSLIQDLKKLLNM